MPPLEPVHPVHEGMTSEQLYDVAKDLVANMSQEEILECAYKYQVILFRKSLTARKKRASKHTKNKE